MSKDTFVPPEKPEIGRYSLTIAFDRVDQMRWRDGNLTVVFQSGAITEAEAIPWETYVEFTRSLDKAVERRSAPPRKPSRWLGQ